MKYQNFNPINIAEALDIEQVIGLIKIKTQHLNKNESIIIQFSKVSSFELSALAILFSWIVNLSKNGFLVEVRVSNDCVEIDRTGFFSQLIKASKNIEIISNVPVDLPVNPSFNYFNEESKFRNYCRTIQRTSKDNQGDVNKAKNAISDIIIKSIAVFELAENAFMHGGGDNVSCSTSIVPLKNKRVMSTESLENNFIVSHNLEIVVGDSGDGIHENIKKSLPSGYIPAIQLKKGLSLKNKTAVSSILYALEFHSTGDLEKRRNRIIDLFTYLDSINNEVNSNEEIETLINTIPTGLYYISSIVRDYGGEIIIYSSGYEININYFRSTKPYLDYRPVSNLKGTIVQIRIPLSSAIKDDDDTRFQTVPYNIDSVRSQLHLATLPKSIFYTDIAPLVEKTNDPASFIAEFPSFYSNLIKVAKKEKKNVISLHLETLKFDAKIVNALLIHLAVMPREGMGLLVFGLEDEFVKQANEMWQKISQFRSKPENATKRFFGFCSFVLVSKESNTICFGDQNLKDSSVLQIGSHDEDYLFSFSEDDICGIIRQGRKKLLKKFIGSSRVKHSKSEKIYLIEKKYYTRVFYEISKLFDDPIYLHFAEEYFVDLFLNQIENIGDIFVIAEPLRRFAEKLSTRLPHIQWYYKSKADISATFQNLKLNRKDNTKKIIVFVDVLCTGAEVKRLIGMSSNPELMVVVSFVNGYKSPYIIQDAQQKPVHAEIVSLLSKEIYPLPSKPKDQDLEVIVIDPLTHSPTAYDRLKSGPLRTRDLLRRSSKAKALYFGHYEFKERHFSTLLYFPYLINELKLDLFNWWDKTIAEDIEKKNTISFYLSEDDALGVILEEYFADKPIKLNSIDREQLYAPYEVNSPLPSGSHIWIILTVINDGETLRDFLKLAELYKPGSIKVSIIVARMNSQRLTFYKSITGFKNIEVAIDILSLLTIPAYTAIENCPMCEIESHYQDIVKNLTDHPRLYNLIEKKTEIFSLKKIRDTDFALNISHEANPKILKLIHLRAMFENAMRVAEARRKLESLLTESYDSRENQIAFLEMAGLEMFSRRLNKKPLEKVLYGDVLANLQIAAETQLSNPDCPLLQIIGIKRLFPHLLDNPTHSFRKVLFSAYSERKWDLFENLIFLCLDDDEYLNQFSLFYGECSNEIDDEVIPLCKELADWNLLRNYNNNKKNVELYHDILREFTRSTDWGMCLENLRTSVFKGLPNKKNLQIAYSNFVEAHQNLKKKIDTISSLKHNQNTLWNILLTASKGRIESYLNEIHNHVSNLDQDIVETFRPNSVTKTIENITRTSIKVIKELKKLYTSAYILESNFVKYKERLIDIDIHIPSDQPGLFCFRYDLFKIIDFYLENVQECHAKGRVNVTLEFEKFDEKRTKLKMIDDLVWQNYPHPSGGLESIKKICSYYDAELNIQRRKDSGYFLEVVFWNSNRRKNYDQEKKKLIDYRRSYQLVK